MRCGNNRNGALGIGGYRSRCRFEEVVGFGEKIVEIKGDEHYTFIRLADGTLLSCGNNYNG
ncbi:MAG: hypothetical protein Hyperionvirus1_211, partial [Hyperionvirus sp.]